MRNAARRLGLAVAVLGLLAGAADQARAGLVTVLAGDTDSIGTDGWNINDNTLRGYTFMAPSSDKIDGYMKFDLSAIADDATITGLSLSLYVNTANLNPEIRVYRVADDSWSRANTSDAHPALGEVLTGSLTPTVTGFYNWSLDVGATNWATDLTDNVLTLAIHNENNTYSYLYANGSNGPFGPSLAVTTSDVVPTPEPSTIALACSAVPMGLGLAWRRRRKPVTA